MSYEPVPDGQLAAVVTFLEMRKAPAGESATSPTAQEEAPMQLGLFDM